MESQTSDWRYPFRQAIFSPKRSNGRSRRVFVYLPRDVTDSLQIDDGDCVTFVVAPKVPYVVLANFKNAPILPKSLCGDPEDPRLMVARLQAELVVIDAKTDALEEAWNTHSIQNQEYLLEKERLRQRIEEIKNGLGKIYKNSYYRGGEPDLDNLESMQVVAFAREYAEGVVSEVDNVLSDLEYYSKKLKSLKAMFDEGLIDEGSYKQASERTETKLRITTDAVMKISKLFSAKPPVDLVNSSASHP